MVHVAPEGLQFAKILEQHLGGRSARDTPLLSDDQHARNRIVDLL
jgi:hypothetical protein